MGNKKHGALFFTTTAWRTRNRRCRSMCNKSVVVLTITIVVHFRDAENLFLPAVDLYNSPFKLLVAADPTRWDLRSPTIVPGFLAMTSCFQKFKFGRKSAGTQKCSAPYSLLCTYVQMKTIAIYINLMFFQSKPIAIVPFIRRLYELLGRTVDFDLFLCSASLVLQVRHSIATLLA